MLLLRDINKGIPLTMQFIKDIFPLVDSELARWNEHLADCPDPQLKKQGLLSIAHKRFHALGGSFYALYSREYQHELVRFITALQTISDYLDNLCDRVGIYDEKTFRTLHYAMLDAVCPKASIRDYYRYYPHTHDGGYLETLVKCCQDALENIPAYPLVQGEVVRFVKLYCDLQVYKHVAEEMRVSLLKSWFEGENRTPGLLWWEFAAACGSTLGVFSLTAAACQNLDPTEARCLKRGYFPWICGLHILLDYYIDQEEDAREGDLNFVSFYNSRERTLRRLHFFLEKSRLAAKKLPRHPFHQTAVHGLLAMYLSDEKVVRQGLQSQAKILVSSGGFQARALYRLCGWLRKKYVL